MSAAYRDAALTCPGCGDALEPQHVGDAVIDVCPSCGGIWVDWFDGELLTLVRGAAPLEGAPAPPRAGSSACPRCHLPLAAEGFRNNDAVIHRCSDCAGAFVPQAAAETLAQAPAEDPPSAGGKDAWSRLAAVLKQFFGWDEKQPS